MSEEQATESRTIVALIEACDEMGDRLLQINTGGFFCKLTCIELESIASVLRLSGNLRAATFITHEHAVGDDDPRYDDHYNLGRRLEALTEACEDCNFTHHHTHN